MLSCCLAITVQYQQLRSWYCWELHVGKDKEMLTTGHWSCANPISLTRQNYSSFYTWVQSKTLEKLPHGQQRKRRLWHSGRENEMWCHLPTLGRMDLRVKLADFSRLCISYLLLWNQSPHNLVQQFIISQSLWVKNSEAAQLGGSCPST